ncbi:MAG: hypothetical protein ACPGXX_16310 [Planctomycetaceae bacterium]
MVALLLNSGSDRHAVNNCGRTSLGVESIEFDDKLAGASIHGYESLG